MGNYSDFFFCNLPPGRGKWEFSVSRGWRDATNLVGNSGTWRRIPARDISHESFDVERTLLSASFGVAFEFWIRFRVSVLSSTIVGSRLKAKIQNLRQRQRTGVSAPHELRCRARARFGPLVCSPWGRRLSSGACLRLRFRCGGRLRRGGQGGRCGVRGRTWG